LVRFGDSAAELGKSKPHITGRSPLKVQRWIDRRKDLVFKVAESGSAGPRVDPDTKVLLDPLGNAKVVLA
jgi:hypothetical protein